ncbi:hypothetical protein ZWY2020_008088 [Hordeum vulgare]|nr:hypothetical protein ZWY2020_008088 [Hordeum vulgare]
MVWDHRSGHLAKCGDCATVNGRYTDRSGRNLVINPHVARSRARSLLCSHPPAPVRARRRSPSPRAAGVDHLDAMPSRNVGETSFDDDCQAVSMDMGLLEAPDTIVEPLFCGQLELSEPKCILHHMRPLKCVAFEGTLTGRRFYGCPVQENGVNYGVVEWVDGPWPPVLQRCLDKLWEMFHEQNCGRVLDKEKFEKELAKLKTENDKLSME